MDIIVVFGSVTSDAYQYLRLAMMRKGLKPKIVRFDKEHRYETRFDLVDCAEERMDKQCDIADTNDDPHAEALLDRAVEHFIDEVFDKEMIADIKAVIFPPSEWGRYSWSWVTKRFPRDYAEYTVQVSEDDGSY